MNDLISVIVPMYNVEKYINKTLKSIVNQTYTNFEVILIDDASTDKTVEIAESYAYKYENIKLVKQDVNKGVSIARNLGMELARGAYITFVDADDLLTKEALEILYSTAMESDADLVLGVYKILSNEGTRLSGLYNNFKSLSEEGRVFTFTNPEIFSHVYVFGKLYKKELVSGVFFPEKITYAEDQPFTMYSYLNARNIHIAPKVVYYHRERIQDNSATSQTIKDPIKTLQSVFDSFEIGQKYVNNAFEDKNNYALLLYFSRVVQGSIRFIFEGVLMTNNQTIIQSVLNQLKKWIESLDDYLVLGTNSVNNIFLDNGQVYIKYMDIVTQKIYLDLLKLIRDKQVEGNQRYKLQVNIKNRLIELFLKTADEILKSNSMVKGDDYSVCNPKVSYFNGTKGQAVIDFQLVEGKKTSLLRLSMYEKNNRWIAKSLDYENPKLMQTSNVNKKKPKILLTYRDFSGCNTLALYKSIPTSISEQFDVEFISGNHMSVDFARKVNESDIVVTTNMEYGFYKFNFNAKKIVIDLWHGFPLKNMFFEDPFYNDKNSIGAYWEQFNYNLSYSNLYSEVVNKCIKVNPNNYFISGAPRNDFLFVKDSREKLFKLLNKEDVGQKIIVYMPTFRNFDKRKDVEVSSNIFGFQKFDFDQFAKFLNDNNFEFIIKSHPIFARNFENLLERSSRISLIQSSELMNQLIDFYEVLGASNILITDYSSVYFDYLLLDKPIIFTPTDQEEYEVERGFILEPYEQWTPGPKVINQIDLQKEILAYKENSKDYKNFRSEIKNKVHYYQDANATERVWKFISRLDDF